MPGTVQRIHQWAREKFTFTWRFYFLRDLVSMYIQVTNFSGVCKPFREKGNYVPIAESKNVMQEKDLICLRIITDIS